MQTVFPAIEPLYASEAAADGSLPIVNINIAGASTYGTNVRRHGLMLKIAKQFVEESTYPWINYWLRLAGRSPGRWVVSAKKIAAVPGVTPVIRPLPPSRSAAVVIMPLALHPRMISGFRALRRPGTRHAKRTCPPPTRVTPWTLLADGIGTGRSVAHTLGERPGGEDFSWRPAHGKEKS